MVSTGIYDFKMRVRSVFSICRRPDDLRGEEQMIRTANDRALQEMRQRLERELEEAKLELLEVK